MHGLGTHGFPGMKLHLSLPQHPQVLQRLDGLFRRDSDLMQRCGFASFPELALQHVQLGPQVWRVDGHRVYPAWRFLYALEGIQERSYLGICL